MEVDGSCAAMSRWKYIYFQGSKFTSIEVDGSFHGSRVTSVEVGSFHGSRWKLPRKYTQKTTMKAWECTAEPINHTNTEGRVKVNPFLPPSTETCIDLYEF